MSVFKFYLCRILGTYNEKTDSVSGPLCYYRDKFRILIGKVLMQSNKLDSPGPYVPLFYQRGICNAANVFKMVNCVMIMIVVVSNFPIQ